nr:immunoglobulin heavy chain junction region [Macaca mulatta]MOV60020.1 immunoglobulin heavy chain junction region [Macaca mulatta]
CTTGSFNEDDYAYSSDPLDSW